MLSAQREDLGSIPSTSVNQPSPGEAEGAQWLRCLGYLASSKPVRGTASGPKVMDGLVRWFGRSKGGCTGLGTQARSLDPTVKGESCLLTAVL